MRRLAVGLALLCGLTTGCRRASPRPLPDHLAAVVRLPDGYASLLLSLPPPGGEGRVRISPGVLAVGPGWLSEVVPDAQGQWQLLQHGPTAPPASTALPDASRQPLLLAVDQGQVTYTAGTERVRLRAGAAPEPLAGALVTPGGRQTWSGPRNGFSLRLLPAERRLQLLLPRLTSDGFDIAVGVEALLGAWWLRIEDLPAWELSVIQAHFRVLSPIPLQPGEAQVDGDLHDWQAYTAVPVEDPSQVIAGGADWTSARDASFGATTLRTPEGALLLAVRVRDDHFVDGDDRLTVLLGTQQLTLSLSATGERAQGAGWVAHQRPLGRLDRAVELRLEPDTVAASAGAPLEVRYHDQDPGESGSIITNAPWPALLGVSPHHLGSSQP